MNKIIKNLVVIAVLGSAAIKADAVPSLGEVWGTTGGSPNPVWVATPEIGGATTNGGVSTVALTLSGINPKGSLGATSAAYDGSYLAYGSALNMTFTLQSTHVPNNTQGYGLQFYFKSGSDIWYATGLDYVTGLGPQTYSFNIGSESVWAAGGVNAQTWAQGFGDVTEIGFDVLGANYNGNQTFTFSGMELTQVVPEPETVWMIMMVLASLALTFRGRLGGIAAQVKARIKA
ncbi:MAG: hypothetical protein WCS52_13430 [bacterium]